jgi:glycosyltransferase involved in cell wall biosynthesis
MTLPRIGIQFAFKDEEWIGGVNGILNLVHAHARLADPRIRLALIAAPSTPDSLLADFPAIEVLRTALVDSDSTDYFARRVLKKLIGRDLLMEGWLRRNDFALMSHCESLGRRAGLPTIGQIADFSYKAFSQLWEPEVLARKEAGTRRICNEHATILMPSRAVQNDYRTYMAGTSATPVYLHIIPSRPIPPRDDTRFAAIAREHGLGERYFYVPSQLWVHKNHTTIIEAMALARLQGCDVQVVCTGQTHDLRRPDHAAALLARAADLGLANRFRVLGLLPLSDTVEIMRHSTAVLSASLFEGWGLSVTEAKMMGKAIILSDIPVFREQDPDHARFFDPHDAQQLADAMIAIWREHDPATDLAHQTAAAARWAAMVDAYARGYEDIVLQTLARWHIRHPAEQEVL